MITLDEMKGYLRVDYDDDDKLISDLIETSKGICMDVLRVSDEDDLLRIPASKTAILYSTAYLYEHREEADHHAMDLTLRALLFGSRKEGF